MAFIRLAQARRDPRVRKRISERLFRKNVLGEIVATPSWARRAPNVPTAGDLNLQIDIPLAIAANFAVA